ncbi:MAG: response regulator [Thiolinea sp.]
MAKLFFLIFLTCLNLTKIVTANMATTILDDSEGSINANRKIATFKAATKNLKVREISSSVYSKKFQPNNIEANNYGYHDNDFWLRLNIRSESTATWYLTIDQVVFGQYELFVIPDKSNNASIQQSSPFFSHIKDHRTPAWKLNLPQHTSFTLYIKIFSPKGPLMLPVRLMQDNEFLSHSNIQYAFFTAILAGLFVLTLHNLILLVASKEISHLIFFIFLLMYQLAIYRFINIYPPLFHLLVDSGTPHFISLLFFTQFIGGYYWYLLYHKVSLALKWLLLGIMFTSLLISLTTLIFPINNQVFSLTSLSLIALIPVITLITFRSKNSLTNSLRNNFFIATTLVLSLSIYAPIYSGLFPEYPVESVYVGMVGHVLTALLFSLNQMEHNRQLRAQAERSEINNKATQNFLTTMSHELRTPMHTILGANELLKNTPLAAKQQRYLGSAELAARQMLALINDILDTARLNSSKPTVIENHPFSLSKLLEDIEEIFQIQAAQKQLVFSISTKNIPASLVSGDERHLRQTLTNLIGNAIKYTQNGKITLHVVQEAHAAQHEQNNIYFAVHDTGPGIKTEHHELLFQPFYQTDSSHSRHKDGAGLGLAISYQLVQQMGGKLRLKSTPGRGSNFFFTLNLPVCNEPVQKQCRNIAPEQQNDIRLKQHQKGINSIATSVTETHKITPDTKPLSGMKVLLVDDGELNLIIGEQLLNLQGAEVTLAQSGQKALALLTEQPFDLVLMDISMPDMDGYETTRRIRQDANLRALPVIALTAHAIHGERERCLNVGMNDYLSKPFQIKTLLEVIQRHHQAERKS